MRRGYIMNKLVFQKILVFSTAEKQARCLEFEDGINIISSSQVDGTDRGKSVIMRSLYHAMGADCQFDDKWDDNGKTYILLFSIGEQQYYIYRNSRLFKLFNNEKELLFSTIDRKELAEKLSEYFKFSVQLPSRNEDRLEITPPVYNYLPYFIDQDYYNGTDFSSFNGLAQYEKYKENVLYYHFGAFDETYFEIIKELERLNETKSKAERRSQLIDGMLEKANEELKGNSYSLNLNALKADLEMAKDEYSKIASLLSKAKQNLVEFKNQRYELEVTLSELEGASKENEKEINSLNQHVCPMCNTEIIDTALLRSSKYNASDDIIIVSNNIQRSLLDINSKIDSETQKYSELLNVLEDYEVKMNYNSQEVTDVLRHKGFIEVRDSLLTETHEIKQLLNQIKESSDELSKKKKKYNDAKKAINKRYYELLLCDKNIFGLSEIDEKRFENITRKFTASGSNKPIATVMWYMNLIKLINEFNPNSIKFPIVFDSPNNAETDDVKKHELLAYLLKNATNNNQMIISAIGFNKDSFEDEVNCKVTILTNNKYQLLCESDFIEYSPLLYELCNKQ